MSREDKLELLKIMEEKERRARTRKLFGYYPNEGPLKRDLYPKHLQFFDAGNRFRERLFMAANRIGKCISGDTIIESPDGTSRPVKDIEGPHWVWAWNGSRKVAARAHAPFIKPSEMVYRVWLEGGRYVDCAAEHRFLGVSGWLFLSDLFECVPCLPPSTLDSGPLKSIEDVRYYLKTHLSSQADCHRERHSNDERLPSDQEFGRAFFPSLGDVRKHIRSWSRWDALVDKCKHTLSHICDRLSSLCGADLPLGLCAGSLNPGVDSDGSQYLGTRQAFSQLVTESSFLPQSTDATYSHQSLGISSLVSPEGSVDTVICYQPIGVQPIYDFHVPIYKNYCAAGIIHHNTEGAGGYETALHLTGRYPEWWTGRRFVKPIDAWAAGDTSKTVREIIQAKLLGPINEIGTGLIPEDLIIRTTAKQGISDAIDTIFVKHQSGGTSQIVLKSYDQKRYSFQGTEKDWIWLDEEPPLDIYTECLLRTMTNDGMIALTFTPLQGLSETVMSFLPAGQIADHQTGSKFIVTATWDDVPHLSAKQKDELWNSIPPFQRDARSKGIPQLGSGAIYPVPESDFVVDDFPIPEHWPRVYGMDVGWNRTAVPWAAWDRETDTLYLYGEHYRGQAEPSIHAEAIKARGDWIPGTIDPASRGRNQRDGQQLLQSYIDLGLDLTTAFNGVESGIYQVWQRLSTGRLKVFKSMSNWLYEFRLYRRDEKGAIVKANDHLMDATRYLVMSGLELARTKPVVKKTFQTFSGGQSQGWMG